MYNLGWGGRIKQLKYDEEERALPEEERRQIVNDKWERGGSIFLVATAAIFCYFVTLLSCEPTRSYVIENEIQSQTLSAYYEGGSR